MVRHIKVVPHDPKWAARFQIEARQLAKVFGPEAVAVEHIGSSAIPGIKAKPIIDILIAVPAIERVDGLNPAMIELGYEPRGEFGIPGRRYFQKGRSPVEHTHHVHVFESGNPEIARHLDFRDYLRAHPTDAQAYSRLKESLAEKFPHDSERYTNGKSDFIHEIDRKAAAWSLTRRNKQSVADLQALVGAVRQARGFTMDPLQIFALLNEEVGEVAAELKCTWSPNYSDFSKESLAEEVADALVCLLALANQFEIDVEQALVGKLVEKDGERVWPSARKP